MSAPLTIGSLFAGIGGFDLAGEHYGWRTSWFVEWDASCRHWLAEHFPGRPIYGDITRVDFTDVEPVDLLCGGFPCQPASHAGNRKGIADDRWLWPHFARAIGSLRPRYVVAENVPGLVSVNGGRAFAEVLRDLAALGYDAEWDRLSAGDVGAPQERERVWIVAYARRDEPSAGCGDAREVRCVSEAERESEHGPALLGRDRAELGDGDRGRCEQRDEEQRISFEPGSGLVPLGDTSSGRWGARSGLQVRRAERGCASVGNPDEQPAWRDRRTLPCEQGSGESEGRADRRLTDGPWDAGVPVRGADGTVRLIPREAADAGPESPLWPVADGIPGRVARLRAIGNTVVPQCVIEGPFRVIAEREAARVAA